MNLYDNFWKWGLMKAALVKLPKHISVNCLCFAQRRGTMKRLLILTILTLAILIGTSPQCVKAQGFQSPMRQPAPLIPAPSVGVQWRGATPFAVPALRPSLQRVTFPAQIRTPQAFTTVQWQPPLPALANLPMRVEVDANLANRKTSINLHGDQLNLSGTKAVGEFGLTLVDPARFKIRYSLITRSTGTDTLKPSGPLTIGSVEFAKADEKDPKPIQVEHSYGPNHELQLSFLRPSGNSFWLSPTLVGKWLTASITATKDDAGKPVSDSERFSVFRWGVGAEMAVQYPGSRLLTLVVASDNYLMGDLSCRWWVGNNMDIGVGWKAEQVKLARESTLRSQGFYGSAGLRW